VKHPLNIFKDVIAALFASELFPESAFENDKNPTFFETSRFSHNITWLFSE
jgi:hypothetical protein